MKNRYYKAPNIGSAFTDFDGVLRYMRRKDQELIEKDDPDFFAMLAEGKNNTGQRQEVQPHR